MEKVPNKQGLRRPRQIIYKEIFARVWLVTDWHLADKNSKNGQPFLYLGSILLIKVAKYTIRKVLASREMFVEAYKCKV